MPVMPMQDIKLPYFFPNIQEPDIHIVAHPVHLFHYSPILITGNSVIMDAIDNVITVVSVISASCKEMDLVSLCCKSLGEFGNMGGNPSYAYGIQTFPGKHSYSNFFHMTHLSLFVTME
jgi:hypothetical protein